MKKQIKLISLILVAIAVGIVITLFFVFGKDTVSSSVSFQEKTSLSIKSTKQARTGEKVRNRLKRKNKRVQSRKNDLETESDEDDELNLTKEQRAMLASIEQSVDDDNKEALVKIVQNMQAMNGWSESIPQSIRLAAVEALEYFGSSCLPEAAGFLSDSDNDVVQCALSQFEDAVEDSDKSDRERASILGMAALVVNDSETMESMLFELNNMRNSVAAETIKYLWENGNSTTQSLLAETVESVTGESDIDTVEKLDAWLKENPDDEEDEELYGGVGKSDK